MKLATMCVMLALFAQGGSCNSKSVAMNSRNSPAREEIAKGIWGGQHIRVEVSDRGAEIEFDCARGSIARKIGLDASGRFDLDGSFATEHAGPVRDEQSNTRTVRYRGVVRDNEMELTVADLQTKETIGTFNLKFGNEGRLMKCK